MNRKPVVDDMSSGSRGSSGPLGIEHGSAHCDHVCGEVAKKPTTHRALRLSPAPLQSVRTNIGHGVQMGYSDRNPPERSDEQEDARREVSVAVDDLRA
jgi:hypothetical protein